MNIYLKKGEEKRLKMGHLWVFSNEIDVSRSPLTDCTPGEQVTVLSSDGKALGAGYINPASLISVRLFSRNPHQKLNADVVEEKISNALNLREKLFSRPFYRLCHGEGDFLPGLVVDRHGDHLVCQISTAGMDNLTDTVLTVLQNLIKPTSIFLNNDISSRALEGLPCYTKAVFGDVPVSTEIEENGTPYKIPLQEGQKTGWFYDQRYNRASIAQLIGTSDKISILDAFSYVGGFGALATKHGAVQVSFLDGSELALSYAEENAKISSSADIELIHGDAFDELARLRREGRQFDIVCLDPPAFIKRKKDAKQGIEAYRRINELAIDLVKPNGFFMTCSCSHHLETEVLKRLVTSAVAKKHRDARLIRQGFQGPDHPCHPAIPETAYLKTLLYHFAT